MKEPKADETAKVNNGGVSLERRRARRKPPRLPDPAPVLARRDGPAGAVFLMLDECDVSFKFRFWVRERERASGMSEMNEFSCVDVFQCLSNGDLVNFFSARTVDASCDVSCLQFFVAVRTVV